MPDATYGPKVYRKQPGDVLVVASGGQILVESGGKITYGATDSVSVAGEATFTGTGTVATGLLTITAAVLTIKIGTAPGVGTTVVTYTVTGGTLNFFAWKPTSNVDDTLIAATASVVVGWVAYGTV
jgi:hypothetical protein